MGRMHRGPNDRPRHKAAVAPQIEAIAQDPTPPTPEGEAIAPNDQEPEAPAVSVEPDSSEDDS